ncbi:MAG: hypothetical protein ACD_3C00025G0025 [uncultured bacterium (gcode 4)]|uniref:Prepilin-type N-terminal cleavage/methylation domain-containing protein n=1 Tax=uncultured bacterium (gcode 4) TaxID=1234023 RepID=K2FCF4_9BACT|nr:MAG: hypothetical protein ACD_3C00025G0025 [uncultured bacterium (gcode 4)]
MFNENRAFTLVELIVVIVILAILATIAFLTFSSQSGSARDSARMSDMANISKWLVMFNAISGKYPLPDDKVNVLSWTTLLGYQWYVGNNVVKMIKLSNWWMDPIDRSFYTYNTNYSQSRYQILWFLENPLAVSASFNPFGNRNYSFDSGEIRIASAFSYVNRYPYEKWDILWIILDMTWSVSWGSVTYTPIQDVSSVKTLWKVDVTAASSSGYVAVIDNSSSSMTWVSIISTWKMYVSTGTTTGIQYDNCNAATYSGYSISPLVSWSSLNVFKGVSYWTWDLSVNCSNWTLSYWTENINCVANYVLQGWICVVDQCTWSAPEYSISNWTQKVWVSWNHNVVSGQCTYVCQPGYYSNWTSCVAASVGNYVSSSWLSTQTQCAAWTYQSSTGQTSCISSSVGYYASGAGAGEQTACSAGSYQGQAWMTSCISADAWNYVASTWQSSQTQCAAWTYQDQAWQSSCIFATTWKYQDQAWQSTVKSCSNKPASNSAYTVSSGLVSNSCPWGCNAAYHNESNICVSDTRSCSMTNWAWSQTWNWSSWNSCVPTSCNSWYYSNWSACVVPAWWWDAINWFTYYQWTPVYPKTCNELLTSASPNYKIWSTSWNWSKFVDGVYYMKPDSSPAFKAYCDMTTDWWGWTIVASDWLTALTGSLSTISTVPKPNQAWMLMPFIAANLKDFASEMRVISIVDPAKVLAFDITPAWLWSNISLKNSEYWYMYSSIIWFSGWAWSPHKCNFSLIIVWNQWCTEWYSITFPADWSVLGATPGYTSTAYGSIAYSWQFTDWANWLRIWWAPPTGYVWYYDRAQASYMMIRK